MRLRSPEFGGSWMPVFDTSSEQKNKETFWPVAITRQALLCVICRENTPFPAVSYKQLCMKRAARGLGTLHQHLQAQSCLTSKIIEDTGATHSPCLLSGICHLKECASILDQLVHDGFWQVNMLRMTSVHQGLYPVHHCVLSDKSQPGRGWQHLARQQPPERAVEQLVSQSGPKAAIRSRLSKSAVFWSRQLQVPVAEAAVSCEGVAKAHHEPYQSACTSAWGSRSHRPLGRSASSSRRQSGTCAGGCQPLGAHLLHSMKHKKDSCQGAPLLDA